MANSIPGRLVEKIEEVFNRRRDGRISLVYQNVIEEHVNVGLQNVL